MTYVSPDEVISPKAHWHLFDVVLDQGEGSGAYALGTWDAERRIGFRWNGSDEAGPIGNPQSRGLPTWTILDPALHPAVVALLSPEKQTLARRFLGLRAPDEWRSIVADIRHLHGERLVLIEAGKTPIATMRNATLVLHVVPFGAADNNRSVSPDSLFKAPDRFLPIGMANLRAPHSRIEHGGLLIGSNDEGLGKAQRAYVHVSSSGVVEAVASNLTTAGEFLELEKITNFVVKHARNYTVSLNACGFVPPVAVMVGLVGVRNVRLVQQHIFGALLVDMPQQTLTENVLDFEEGVFEAVPNGWNECAQTLRPLLNHLARASGLPTSPFFDADGNYVSKLR